ncbi:MAG TPA: threonine ammonia-lyase [Syntrophobacteraceae bacterium]|nr:threonine ammonia-lyase [Syntrophobacteraceae bacterium]
MITIRDVRQAAEVLRGKILRTPLVYSSTFSKMTGCEVFLKLENLQQTGSFKIRGATFKVLRRRSRIGGQGVVAASAGNHAQGVAMAAAQAGLPATILMPRWASITKQEATRSYGGQVILEGESIEDGIRKAKELAEGGKTFIHPFDDEDIIAGQGTLGLEIVEELPDADTIVVPVGGGGLISGVSLAAKAHRPKIRVIGAQAAACPAAYRSFREGTPVRVQAEKSIADGISIKQVGQIPFAVMRELVDDVLQVSEEEIGDSIVTLLERKKVLAEGAGAVPLAVLLNSSLGKSCKGKVVLVISGGNVDHPLVERIIRRGLFRRGRIMRFSVCLEDAPGSLHGLLECIAREEANVLHIYHDRGGRNLPVYQSRVELELETRGPGHAVKILDQLRAAGYSVSPSRHDDAFE